MRVGILGLGFIGKMHLATFRNSGIAEVVAVADKNPENFEPPKEAAGNIAVDLNAVSLEGVTKYAEGDDLIADENVDVVLITLPTFLHKEYAIKALEAGKHVICEKPLALNSVEGQEIVDAAAKSDKLFFVGHCIRFWPAYDVAREIIQSGKYGKVKRAHFTRLSPKPTWSWGGWLLGEKTGGGCLLDLHIHDVDYASYVFGEPASITTHALSNDPEGLGDVMTAFKYDDKLVTIEGSWNHTPDFPFRMGFRIVCEEAAIEFNTQTDGKLHVYPAEGGDITPEVSEEDGYTCEHRYFFDCIAQNKQPEIVNAESSNATLKLIEREKAAIV